jgi:putative protease
MEVRVGHVKHYYNRLGVAVLSLTHEIKFDNILHFCGHRSDFYQKAWSMEIDHASIRSASSGSEVAIKVAEPVHRNDQVYLVKETTPEDHEIILMQQLREWEGKK